MNALARLIAALDARLRKRRDRWEPIPWSSPAEVAAIMARLGPVFVRLSEEDGDGEADNERAPSPGPLTDYVIRPGNVADVLAMWAPLFAN